MSLGKVKETWPIWTLVIAGIVVIGLALTQNKPQKDAVTFHDIFPEETQPATPAAQAQAVVQAASAPDDPVKSPAIVANTDFNQPQLTYAVQLYSFKDEFRADTMVKKLKADGIPAYAQISDLGTKGTWYRVRVGAYETPDEAKAMLTALVKDHKDSIIVKDKK